MAKTKTKKKEKIVDLSRPEKVTKAQLGTIRSIVDRINHAQMSIGQMESRKHQLLHQIAGINDEMNMVQNELQEQYGTNDISIVDGTINYPAENGSVNKKD